MKISSDVTMFHIVLWPIVSFLMIGFLVLPALFNGEIDALWILLIVMPLLYISTRFYQTDISANGARFQRIKANKFIKWSDVLDVKLVSFTNSPCLKIKYNLNGKIRSSVVLLEMKYIWGKNLKSLIEQIDDYREQQTDDTNREADGEAAPIVDGNFENEVHSPEVPLSCTPTLKLPRK